MNKDWRRESYVESIGGAAILVGGGQSHRQSIAENAPPWGEGGGGVSFCTFDHITPRTHARTLTYAVFTFATFDLSARTGNLSGTGLGGRLNFASLFCIRVACNECKLIYLPNTGDQQILTQLLNEFTALDACSQVLRNVFHSSH